MQSSEIRSRFLSFFEKKNHKIVPSSSLIPSDPTLLLTTAGMVQFKPIFQGEVKTGFTRAASCQKCVRTTDIERVGHTVRHLTFFEMLGNFSFGDYYKKEAITWAWDFLVKDLKFNTSKLWVTVFEDDDEAYEIWKKDVRISDDRLVRLGAKDNFWSAGSTGPCGPCSEILYDFGEDKSCGKNCRVGCDCDRFLEVWNLVFMQYNRDEKGELHPLPKKNIDTGMGIERVSAILQGASNVFEGDLLLPIIEKISSLAGITYGKDLRKDISTKIIGDHARAITFLVGDGVLPSNEGRGYVLRRLLRRAVRHARLLGIEKAFLSDLVCEVSELMSGTYPELKENLEFINRIVISEEERFSQTLRAGLNAIGEAIEKIKKTRSFEIPGELAFRLYDTYGFPLELTREIAQEEGLRIDEEKFLELMEAQKEKARAAWEAEHITGLKEVYNEVLDQFGKSEFVGYSNDSAESKILAIIQNEAVLPHAEEGNTVEIVLEKTPFYAEMGGQVGDKGTIFTETGEVKIEGTRVPLPGVITHLGKITKGRVQIGEKALATVDKARRENICKNHTATHILHWALGKVLGKHVKQAGSYIDDKRLRFDFVHTQGLTDDEISKVEELVSEKIFENYPVRFYETSFKTAKESGAIALFGEKYGEKVRVLEVGDFSKELCGGTHINETGRIGLFKIVGEESIGANLRRIEAYTSIRALKFINEEESVLKRVSHLIKTKPVELYQAIEDLTLKCEEKDKEIEVLQKQLISSQVDDILSTTQEINGVKIVLRTVQAKDMENLRLYIDALREKIKNTVIVLASSFDKRVMLVVAVSSELVKIGLNASEIAKEIAPIVEGGGGGRADMAQAGGKNPEKIPQAFSKAEEYIKAKLKKNSD